MPQDFNYRGPVMVFDLDDTLASERLYCRSGFRFAASWLADRYPQVEVVKIEEIMTDALMKRESHYEALEKYLSEVDMEPAAVMPDLVKACRAHRPDSGYVLAPGVKETLEYFRSSGIRMGLITDGRSITQRRKIEALGLQQYFAPDAIFISEERGVDKHSPDSFEEMVRLFPEAGKFTYVGDNPEKDFRWPNLLGWNTVCIADTDNSHIFPQPDDVEFPYSAKNIISEFDELRK